MRSSPADGRKTSGRRPGASEPVLMASVVLKNLKKVYDNEVTAVQNVNLEVADGEFIVLVGPSGCGKSTTLRMVAGLEDISEGELYIGDKLCNDVAPKDRDIAMVFQSYALYPHMTVRDNIGFSLKLRKVPKDEIDKKVEEAAEILGITEYLDRKPKALSGGQRQRVAIGRAIVRDPKVLLMDEPLSNLDAKLRNQMRAEIIKLRKRIHATFMYVTHDQTEAMTLGDRIVIMQKGGFVNQIGTPQELYNCPVNLFVAGFIGAPQMNFFNDAKLIIKDGKYYAQIKGADFELSELHQRVLKSKNQQPCGIVAGIRPDHVVLDENGLKGKVEVTEMMGASLHLHADCQGDDIVMIISTVGLDQGLMNGTTKEVGFGFPADLLQLFDKETGNNLIWYDEASDKAHAPVCAKW